MNGLDLLRWVLLLIGAAILIAIYIGGRRSLGARWRRRRAGRVELPDVEADAGAESLVAPDPELAELGRSIRIDDQVEPMSAPEPAPPIKAERPRATPPSVSKPEPKIVVVYLVAPSGLPYRGPAVFDAANAAGLEHGDMRIFHHYEFASGRRDSVFSLANMVEPGWFDETEKEQIQSPGLALFLQLPGPMEGIQAFDAMIEAAQRLKRELGGELRDASRSVMSHQTIAHLRDEISEYERQQRTRSGAAR